MDAKISAPTRLEEILAEWDMDQNLTQSTVYSSPQDTITITSALDNMTLTSPYTVTGAIGTTTTWTASPNSSPWFSSNPTGTSARINLSGENADIEVNGWSLVAAVKRIEERLGLFQPNPKLEAEWEELRDLGEQYRKLEQHIKDKQATFDRIKAMPAPETD